MGCGSNTWYEKQGVLASDWMMFLGSFRMPSAALILVSDSAHGGCAPTALEVLRSGRKLGVFILVAYDGIVCSMVRLTSMCSMSCHFFILYQNDTFGICCGR